MLSFSRLHRPLVHFLHKSSLHAKQYSSVGSSVKHVLQSPALDPAIPAIPTWSVHKLLSSYPSPSVPSETLKKMYQLSALIPPDENTLEFANVKQELEQMVRLIEAVKFVDTATIVATTAILESEEGDSLSSIPDGRVCATEKGMALSSNTRDVEFEETDIESGTVLLKYASRKTLGMYIVETEKQRR